MDCLDWVTEAARRSGVRLLPLSPEIAGDLSDRILAATARHFGATLVTRDRSLLGYAERGHLRAIEG